MKAHTLSELWELLTFEYLDASKRTPLSDLAVYRFAEFWFRRRLRQLSKRADQARQRTA